MGSEKGLYPSGPPSRRRLSEFADLILRRHGDTMIFQKNLKGFLWIWDTAYGGL